MEKSPQYLSVCFAYFDDNQFLGWYGGTLGSVADNPKVYLYSELQVGIIEGNFKSKIARLKKRTDSFGSKVAEEVGHHHPVAGALLALGQEADEKVLGQYTDLELRIVVCPEYDGPNPDFDEKAYEAQLDAYKVEFEKAGIKDLPAGSAERISALEEFHKVCPRPRADNWVYADYEKVKAWAANAPTEFLTVIKA